MHIDGTARRSEDWVAFAEAMVRTEQKHRVRFASREGVRAILPQLVPTT